MPAFVLGAGAALADSPDAVRLGAQVLVGIASYVSLLWLFERKALLGAANMLRTHELGT